MASSSPAAVTEQFSALFEEFITALGRGVAQAQAELDRSSIAIQEAIDADPVLSQHGVQATWYQMPRSDLEIKVALAFQGAEQVGGPARAAIPAAVRPPRIFIQPVNARYQNQFRYDATAASTLRVTIVPVPPRQATAG
jgi:hypothetical protein